MNNETKNFLYNVIYQMFIYIFPLITIPYTSRILGVDNIGIYSYTYSIVYVFMIFAILGINNYGSRAIAKNRDCPEKLSKTFFSIYFFQLFLSSFICMIYIIFLLFFCEKYKIIFCIHFIHLLSVCFDVSWFFFGLEQFKMPMKRDFCVKLLSLIFIFIFVKYEKDLWIYTAIMAGSSFISQIYLVLKLRYYIHYEQVTKKDIWNHCKSPLILFVPVLTYGIYRLMDKIMLGSTSFITQLGYYENAEKIIHIPISVIAALGTVMLPYMSSLVTNEKEQYKTKIWESMQLSIILSVMMALGIILVAKDVSLLLFGKAFYVSGYLLQMLSITVILSAWSNVLSTQYLIPYNKDKIYVYSVIGGIMVNFICNLFFIYKLGAVGACIGTVLAELFVAIYQSIYIRKYLEIKRYLLYFIVTMSKGVCIIGLTLLCTFYISNLYIRVILQIVVCIFLFFIFYYNYILNDFLHINQKKRKDN